MNILEKIIANKQNEVAAQRLKVPTDHLIRSEKFERKTISLKDSIKNSSGIIAEYKRSSPSKPVCTDLNLLDVLSEYDKQEIAGVSVLTDKDFFSGSLDDVSTARAIIDRPILRKEFIIDEYQIFEAKAAGADAVLLIAEALDEYHILSLTTIAHALGLEVLLELHDESSIDKINDQVDIIGINNRNLKTLDTTVEQSLRMQKYLPYETVKISESGISNTSQIKTLSEAGYDGFLIGTSVLDQAGLLAELVETSLHYKCQHHEG